MLAVRTDVKAVCFLSVPAVYHCHLILALYSFMANKFQLKSVDCYCLALLLIHRFNELMYHGEEHHKFNRKKNIKLASS